ncbi:MAG: hypothetical protein JW730_11490 [Anaerolineales bacterium]|nr:hypothetical protein [Anaerolineales bacterium]
MSDRGRGNPACPYLGLEDDADTSLAFPSVWNTCHRSRRVVSPSLQHQAEYCLSENHRNCVAFPAGQATLPLPHRLRASRRRTSLYGRSPFRGLVFVFIGILVLAGIGWGLWAQGYILPTGTEIPSLTMTVLMTPVPTQTTALTPTPTSAMIVTPKPISTGEAVPKRQLDQPIGSDYQFVIHRVLDGENLNQYAAKYNTSIEAILMVNYDFKTPLWVDALVIIPVGFTNVSSLPAFEAYEVPRADMSLKVLALGFGVSLKDLRYYNAIGMDESLQVGDWLLIPRPRVAP